MAIMPTCTLMTNLLISSTCVALHTQDRSSGMPMNRAQNWPGSSLGRSEHSMARKQLYAYRNDGEYTIDNLVAERTIRNMTIQRKNSLFFCSDKGARNSAIYNTFISICPKYASDDNRGMKISEKSLKLTIQKFNDPALRAVKRVYTQFWTDTK